MTDLAFLLDAPTAPARTYPVARLGRFHHARFGDFAIDPAIVGEWQRKLNSVFDGRVAIDTDHTADRGGSTRAAGWITGLGLDGDKVLADVEWTPFGEGLLKGGEYRYFSISFSDLRDEQARDLGPGLLGATLTNRPFFRDLPAVSLDAAAIDPKETTMPTLLDSKVEEARTLAARENLDPYDALRRTGAWAMLKDATDRSQAVLAEIRRGGPVLLEAAAPEGAAEPLGSVEQVFAENEGLKAAFDYDLNNQNSEALREHAATLERGGAVGVPEHLSLGRLTVDPQADEARDRARAARLDLDFDREAWEAHAALGGDYVNAQFEAQRQQKIGELRGAADRYDAFYREKAERLAAQTKQFEADERVLLDEIGREERVIAAGRPGGLDAGGVPVTNARIVDLKAKLANLRDNRPGRIR